MGSVQLLEAGLDPGVEAGAAAGGGLRRARHGAGQFLGEAVRVGGEAQQLGGGERGGQGYVGDGRAGAQEFAGERVQVAVPGGEGAGLLGREAASLAGSAGCGRASAGTARGPGAGRSGGAWRGASVVQESQSAGRRSRGGAAPGGGPRRSPPRVESRGPYTGRRRGRPPRARTDRALLVLGRGRPLRVVVGGRGVGGAPGGPRSRGAPRRARRPAPGGRARSRAAARRLARAASSSGSGQAWSADASAQGGVLLAVGGLVRPASISPCPAAQCSYRACRKSDGPRGASGRGPTSGRSRAEGSGGG